MDSTGYQVSTGKKPNKPFIVFLIVSIVLFIAGCVLGYLFWAKNRDYKNLKKDQTTLQEQQGKTANELKKENDKLKADVAKLQKQITTSGTASAAQKTKVAAYTDTLGYLAYLLQTHDGLDGWTEGEYQTGRAKAVKTGDQSFIDLIDWAWNHTEVSQITRIYKFLQGVVDGINNAMK